MHLSYTPPSQVGEVLTHYFRESQTLEEQKAALRQQKLRIIDEQMEENLKNPSSNPPINRQLNLQATIALFAPIAGDVSITIVYGEVSFQDSEAVFNYDNYHLACPSKASRRHDGPQDTT